MKPIIPEDAKIQIIKQNYDTFQKAYATNNWLRNHGYPSRRKPTRK